MRNDMFKVFNASAHEIASLYHKGRFRTAAFITVIAWGLWYALDHSGFPQGAQLTRYLALLPSGFAGWHCAAALYHHMRA